MFLKEYALNEKSEKAPYVRKETNEVTATLGICQTFVKHEKIYFP